MSAGESQNTALTKRDFLKRMGVTGAVGVSGVLAGCSGGGRIRGDDDENTNGQILNGSDDNTVDDTTETDGRDSESRGNSGLVSGVYPKDLEDFPWDVQEERLSPNRLSMVFNEAQSLPESKVPPGPFASMDKSNYTPSVRGDNKTSGNTGVGYILGDIDRNNFEEEVSSIPNSEKVERKEPLAFRHEGTEDSVFSILSEIGYLEGVVGDQDMIYQISPSSGRDFEDYEGMKSHWKNSNEGLNSSDIEDDDLWAEVAILETLTGQEHHQAVSEELEENPEDIGYFIASEDSFTIKYLDNSTQMIELDDVYRPSAG